ncbi:mariner transposase [Plakobranchus ocellatus]|uniref:Mariner transposase n=1 Tax=Plakobranchus ocellatus TaxID=259542 RepID=A0AAV4BWW8_9GAST|nr:mariner transposase [Plakobranchus ocellatus]
MSSSHKQHSQCLVLQNGYTRQIETGYTQKRSGLLQTTVIFHHDTAPVHTAKMVIELLDEYEWSVLERPRYSPDIAPCDFWLFPKMKKILVVTYLSQRKKLFSR